MLSLFLKERLNRELQSVWGNHVLDIVPSQETEENGALGFSESLRE